VLEQPTGASLSLGSDDSALEPLVAAAGAALEPLLDEELVAVVPVEEVVGVVVGAVFPARVVVSV
jgi:hypothetical protein